MDQHSFGYLDLDPDAHWDRQLDPNPTNADPQQWFFARKFFLFVRNRIGFGFRNSLDPDPNPDSVNTGSEKSEFIKRIFFMFYSLKIFYQCKGHAIL
jgi:hypothetical protein